MGERVTYSVTNKNAGRTIPEVTAMINKGLFKGPVEVVLQRPGKTPDQHRKVFPMIRDIQTQVDYLGLKTEQDWRQFFCGIVLKQRPVATPDGGIVMIGASIKDCDKADTSTLIEYLYWFGTDKGVRWSDEALAIYEQYKEAS